MARGPPTRLHQQTGDSDATTEDGDILGSSPMTVKKHLERIFVKRGVETRTAAAGMAMTRIRQLHPQFEG